MTWDGRKFFGLTFTVSVSLIVKRTVHKPPGDMFADLLHKSLGVRKKITSYFLPNPPGLAKL